MMMLMINPDQDHATSEGRTDDSLFSLDALSHHWSDARTVSGFLFDFHQVLDTSVIGRVLRKEMDLHIVQTKGPYGRQTST